MNHQVSAAEVLRYIEHADFPATRDRLINIAAAHNATDDVLAALDIIPEREYADTEDLVEEIEKST